MHVVRLSQRQGRRLPRLLLDTRAPRFLGFPGIVGVLGLSLVGGVVVLVLPLVIALVGVGINMKGLKGPGSGLGSLPKLRDKGGGGGV